MLQSEVSVRIIVLLNLFPHDSTKYLRKASHPNDKIFHQKPEIPPLI